MNHVLLIGAGFSRNWGGWLATEAFEYLLGCPEVAGDVYLRTMLWKHREMGGFEDALAEVQTAYIRDPQTYTQHLQALQSAVVRMFEDMNRAFYDLQAFEFQQYVALTIRKFLVRFDAIYSLNQDVLLEHHYLNTNVALAMPGKWNGPELPGMRPVPGPAAMPDTWATKTWEPVKPEEFKVSKKFQPFFKLHGSSNWKGAMGEPLLVIGGRKGHEIQSNHVLRWYSDCFRASLTRPDTRLMVIGYGFKDLHINEVIVDAVAMGLRMFIVDPLGSDLARAVNPTRGGQIRTGSPLEDAFAVGLIGASRRSLRETFGGDLAEHQKLMRFFDT